MNNIISIVHPMAYPGPMNTNTVSRGEADENYLLTTLKSILDDGFFGGIEVTDVRSRRIREKVKDLLKQYKKAVTFSAQPVQLGRPDDMISPHDISSIDEGKRLKSLRRMYDLIDEAYSYGAWQFAFVSGRDVGLSSGLNQRLQAKGALQRSIHQMYEYSDKKAAELKVEPLVFTIEMFDRLDEIGCKNQLIGPSTEAIELVQQIRYTYGHVSFGIMYDLSHMHLIKDESLEGETVGVLKVLRPYLNHIHIGNCVLDKNDGLYGDSHVGLDYANGAVSKDELAEFLKTLNEINYTKGIGFEVTPHGTEQSDSLIYTTKAYFEEAKNRIDVNYAIGSYTFVPRQYLSEDVFDKITDIRVNHPDVILDEAHARIKRKSLTTDGKLLILACDHPARFVTNVGNIKNAMGDRLDYLSRIVRVISSDMVDGVMTTPDIMEDLFILNYMLKQSGYRSILDEKVLVGCMNRGGLAGAKFEIDDRMSAFTADSINRMNLDAAKIMFRLDKDEKYSGRTMIYCADAITQCNKYDLTVFLEALPVDYSDGKYSVLMNAEDMVKVIGVASALGDSSRNLWLKIPYVSDYYKVARATSLPILMLGGESSGNPTNTIMNFEKGMGAGRNIRGAMVGRNVLYPGHDDPKAVAESISLIIHKNASTLDAVRFISENRGKDRDFLSKLE